MRAWVLAGLAARDSSRCSSRTLEVRVFVGSLAEGASRDFDAHAPATRHVQGVPSGDVKALGGEDE